MDSRRFVVSWRWCVVWALFAGGCAHPGAAGEGTASAGRPASLAKDAAKERKVRRLMALTGAEASGKMVLDMMTDHMQRSARTPPGFVEKFREVAGRESLVDQLVPIYMKHLSEEDLEAAIAFHESSAGQRFLKAQPVVMQEAKEVGEAWGVRLAEKALREMREEKEKKEAAQEQRL